MPSLKRTLANALEKISGNYIVPKHTVHSLPERLHLARFFEHFNVDCVFDVGANRGQYATLLREQVRYTGDIVSFEPIPAVARDLRSLASNDKHWHVEELALDVEAGPAVFNVMQTSEFSSLHQPIAAMAGVVGSGNTVEQSIQVMRSTVAAQWSRLQPMLGYQRPFLKIDTQGNDLAVIEGAGDLIREFVGIQTEMSIQRIYEGSAGISETLAALHERGFEVSAFVATNEWHFPQLVEIDCILCRRDAPMA